MLSNSQHTERLHQLQQLARLLIVGFVVVGLMLVYWNVVRAGTILSREDNPRQVEDALRIRRGSIVDRNGRLLAQSTGTDHQTRHYPYTTIGPAVGYYSFRHGTAGIEESYDAWLRGDSDSDWAELWRQILNEPRRGHHIQMTIDVEWQLLAGALLPDQPSALLLLELPQDGQNLAPIRALVSHPGYDPNELGNQFEALLANENAPLLNRVTQGQYQPGRLLLPFVIAGAAEMGWIDWEETAVPATPAVLIGNQALTCLSRPPDLPTWRDMVAHACPYPLTRLGTEIDPDRLAALLAGFGFDRTPVIPLATTGATFPPILDAGLAIIGQEQLTLSPLQIGQAWAAVGSNGRLPTLQLVTAVRPHDTTEWQPIQPAAQELPQPLSEPTARQLRDVLPRVDERLEYSLLVLSGEQSNNSWYLGLAPANNPRYALIIAIENTADPQAAARIGRQLWPAVLSD
jgi:penicillin-binding protein A